MKKIKDSIISKKWTTDSDVLEIIMNYMLKEQIHESHTTTQ